MKHFTLLIKPASADCNLNCHYCFYLSRSALYPETKKHRMTKDVLETMIRKYMELDLSPYAFAWQGGEPTVMGLDFYKKVVELQKKHGRPGSVVGNSLQTNARLVDDEFAAFLGEYKFLLGVSLDGPAKYHDSFRFDKSGKGSHDQVMTAIAALRRNNVEFNILSLINSKNVEAPKAIYQYLCDNGFFFHQYIPCVEFDETGRRLPFSISGNEWGQFLIGVFDEWVKRDARKVSIRFFDSILAKLIGEDPHSCHFGTNCCQYFVVEYNGDVYPCDFFVDADKKLGNLATSSWDDLFDSPLYRNFGVQKSQYPAACTECDFLWICAGDCLKHRLCRRNSPYQLSCLCKGLKDFYRHTLPAFRHLAKTVKREREKRQSFESNRKNPSNIQRNDICPCGSGKKFKNCCMNKVSNEPG